MKNFMKSTKYQLKLIITSIGECHVGKKEELEKLIAERDRLYEDHLKEHEKIAKKSYEWSIKNHKGGLDGYNPYDEEYRKVNIKFLEKVKKINAELEQLKD